MLSNSFPSAFWAWSNSEEASIVFKKEEYSRMKELAKNNPVTKSNIDDVNITSGTKVEPDVQKKNSLKKIIIKK